MNSSATDYDTAARPLTAVIEAVPEPAWSNPSPCEGWTARDVVRHLIQTQREFLIGHGAALGDEPDIDSDPAQAWRGHAKRVLDALSDDALPATTYDGYFGPTTVGATFQQFYVWDMLVHRWDIARAAGLDAALHGAQLTHGELDRIEQGADSFGPALYSEGICRPAVPAPADADRQVRVLARMGRAA